MAVGAGQLLREAALTVVRVLLPVHEVEHHDAVGQAQGGLDRIGQPLFGSRLHREPVDDHLDIVLLLFLQLRRIGERIHHPVDAHPGITLGVELVEQIDEFPLAGPDHRREDLEADTRLHLEHLVDDLLWRLLGDQLPAGRAVRGTGAGVEQAQIVVHLGDGADRGPRIAVGGF